MDIQDSFIKTEQGEKKWLCRCDCDNEVDVSYNNLVYGSMRSCGRQEKEHDKELGSFLTHVDGTFIDVLRSKKIPSDNTTGYTGVYLIRGKYFLNGIIGNTRKAKNRLRQFPVSILTS